MKELKQIYKAIAEGDQSFLSKEEIALEAMKQAYNLALTHAAEKATANYKKLPPAP